MKRGLVLLLLLVLVILGGFVAWASRAAPPQAQALQLIAQPQVTESGGVWHYQPDEEATTALIFYPGGRVDPRAYAPILLPLAEAGFHVFAPQMPLNLAIFDINRADAIIAANPDITHWVIGGHSMGGAFAAQYAQQHPARIEGLLLLAAYPPDSASLLDADLPVVSVYATLDGLATPAEIAASQALLPPDTRFIEILGGNHAGFGDYGPQSGDGAAQITAAAQWQQTLAAAQSLLDQVARGD